MDPLTISAASGMRARIESLDLLANNIANASTTGYKVDREFYNLYTAPEQKQSGDTAQGTLPLIERSWTDFSQGTIEPTGNALDLALSGKGFFAVNGPSGKTLYTRNGSLQLALDGKLQTKNGYPLRAEGGGVIRVDPSQRFEVTSDGSVQQNGATIAKVELAAFDQPASLEKRDGTYFQLTDSTLAPRAASAEVQQGRIEAANASAPETAVRLVNVMRQFEMLHKAVAIGAEMNRQAIEQVARVSSS